jgi:hypothetical protein
LLINQLCRFRKKEERQRAAYTLLAKVSLYHQKKWQQVVDNCNLVTGYSIVSDYAPCLG